MSLILWYLIATLAGLAAFPLAYCLLHGLPDRGYAFTRSLGVLVWGYVFWIGGTLGFLQNDIGGLLLALAALMGLSALAVRRMNLDELSAWFRSRRQYILWVELLFLMAFAGYAFVRSANPEILGTEKPMEVAFINSILRSESFPPNDPWLSGFAISYYYFGYVLVAMFGKLSVVPGSIAFNLGLSLIFSLTAVGAFGLVYNLLASRSNTSAGFGPEQSGREVPPVYALFGPLFILIVSNIEGFLEVLHARGLFWGVGPGGEAISRFWRWLDIADLTGPPGQPLSWLPRLYGTGNWWWWRASRVVQDYNFASDPVQIIDEFPFFSYLLGDLHPHVLAMPFAFLVMGLALNLCLGGSRGRIVIPGIGLSWNISPPAFLLAAIALGGMAFLNTWDWPIYLAFFAGAYVLQAAQQRGWGWERLGEFTSLGLALGVSGFLLYLPFFISFSSQAGGLLPSTVFLTRGSHLWVMFAPLLAPLFAFTVYLMNRYGDRSSLKNGLVWTAIVLAALSLVSLFLVLAIANLPVFAGINPLAATAEDLFLRNLGVPNWGALLQESFVRRLIYPGGWLTLVSLLILCAGLLSRIKYKRVEDTLPVAHPYSTWESPSGLPSAHVFALLLILSGVLLVLVPDFIYLRDQFGSRMNTIFKFYFQAWLLWGIAAAYGTAVLFRELRGIWRGLFKLLSLLMLGMALFYPILSLWDKTQGFNPPQGLTLDGAAYIQQSAPNEMAAIDWLRSAPPGNMVEAVRPDGGQYSDFGRVSAHTGQPTVLGWIGHQLQWRGGNQEIGSRQGDIDRLYSTRNWEEAEQILRQYEIRYVYIGARERSTYRLFETKFERFLTPVFRQGEVVIYESPR
jgi:YYY domain-containing protein